MPSNPYDAFAQETVQRQQAAPALNIAGVQSVNPQNAVDAIKAEPLTGVPATMSMNDPSNVNTQAQTTVAQGIASHNPAVGSWATTADPAKIAATKDDFGSLANLAQHLDTYIRPVQDWAAAYSHVANQFVEAQNPKKVAGLSGTIEAAMLPLNIAGAAFAPLIAAGGRAYADLPIKMIAGGDLTKIPENLLSGKPAIEMPHVASQAEREQQGQEFAGQLLMLMGGKANVAERGAIFKQAAEQYHGDTIVKSEPVPSGPVSGQLRLTGPDKPVEVVPPEVPPTGENPAVDSAKSALAEVDAQHVAEMQDIIAGSKINSRSPTLMQEFIDEHAAPDQSVWVHSDTLAKLYEDGHSPFSDMQPQIEAAQARGGDVEIPLGKYLTETAGQPWADELRQATRFTQDGLSQVEAKELKDNPQPQVAPPTQPQNEAAPKTVALDARDEIIKQVRAQFLHQMFKTPEAAGMTADQFDRYSSAIEEQIAKTTDKLVEKKLAETKKELTPEFKNRVAELSPQVEQELAAHPGLQVQHSLAHGKLPLGEPVERLRLGRDELSAAYGEDVLKQIPERWTAKKSESGYDNPTLDTIAEEYGYRSGEAMVKDLRQLELDRTFHNDRSPAEQFKRLVKEEAERRVKTELGYSLDPNEMRAAVREALNGPEITDFLSKELQALAKQADLPFSNEEVKARAEELFGQLSLKEALNVKAFERTSGRTGRAAEVALLKNKPIDAFRAKQTQLINNHMLQMSHDLNDLWNKTDKQWRRYASNQTLAKVDQGYLDWVHRTLNDIGYPVKRSAEELRGSIGDQTLPRFIQEKLKLGDDLEYYPAQPNVNPKKMSVDDFNGVRRMVSSFIQAGTRAKTIELLNATMELEDAAQSVIDTLNKRDTYISRQAIQNPKFNERVASAARFADAWLVRMEQLALDMGSYDPDSTMNKIVLRMQDRKGWSDDRRTELAKHFSELQKSLEGDRFDKWLKVRVDEPDFLDANGDRLFGTNKDVVVAALHFGEAQAWEKFNTGFRLDKALTEKMLHSRMTAGSWKFVQGVWDAFEKLAPEIERQYKARTGVSPPMIKARGFDTQFGKQKGGYFPVLYDMEGLPDSVKQFMDPMEFLGSPDYVRAVTANSYAKARNDSFSAPVRMNLDGVHFRLNQVIHDLAYRDALIDTNKLFQHKGVRQAVKEKVGPEYLQQMDRWLKAIAGSESADLNKSDFVSNMLNNVNNSMMVNFIGYSWKTLMKHGSGALAASINEVGAVNLMRQYARWAMAPKETWDYVQEHSPEVRHRLLNANEGVRTAYFNLLEKQGFMAEVQKYAFHLVGWSDQFSAVTTWLAREEMELAAHPDDPERAWRLADQSVRQAHGSGGKVDQPDALRSGSNVPGQFWALSNRFLTVFNHMYNRIREIPQSINTGGQKAKGGDWAGATRDFSHAAGNTFAYILIPAMIEHLAQSSLKKEVRKHSLIGDIAKALVYQPFSGIPLLHDFMGAALGINNTETPLTQMGKTIAQDVKDVGEWSERGRVPKKWVEHGMDTVGWFSGGKIPGHVFSKQAQFISDYASGREHPRDAVDLIKGALLGINPKGRL
jgi:hypothetical protein